MQTVVAPRLYAFHQKQPDSRWWSVGISAALTAALFAASFIAMKSVAPWIDESPPAQPPELIRFAPPPVVAPKTPRRPPPPVSPPQQAQPVPSAPSSIPTTVPTIVPTIVPTTVPTSAITAPSAGVAPRADSANAATAAAPTAHAGAPIAPVGVVGKRAPALTAAERAASLRASMASIPEYVRTHPPTGQELADIQAGKRQAEMLARRVGTAGNSRDVHVMTGNAKDGAGVASGGLGSIPFPFLEPGPSAAQRKRDEAIDADNRARFLRLDARLVAKRDSARADSLRRDSLARKAVVPKPTSAPRDTSAVRLRPFRRT